MVERDDYDLTQILAAVVALSLVSVVYIGLTATATSESHTEFYVLNPDGEASDYPTSLSVDENGTVLIGLSNAEGEQRAYTIVLQLDEERIGSRNVTVRDGETWERNLSFAPRSSGTKQLQILLYDGLRNSDLSEPRQQLRLWVEVRSGTTQSAMASQSQ